MKTRNIIERSLYIIDRQTNPELKINIQLTEEIKPTSYHLPVMKIGNHWTHDNTNSLYCEIWSNTMCIWRKSSLVTEELDIAEEAENLWQQTLDEIIVNGLFHQHNVHKDLYSK